MLEISWLFVFVSKFEKCFCSLQCALAMAFFPFPKAVSMFLGHTIIVWYKMETGSFQSKRLR